MTQNNQPPVAPDPPPPTGGQRASRLTKALGSITVLGFIGFVLNEFHKCETARPAVVEARELIQLLLPQNVTRNVADLETQRDQALAELKDIDRKREMHAKGISAAKAIHLVGGVSDKLCKAYLGATQHDVCSIWKKGMVSLNSVPPNDWLAALASAKLPTTNTERQGLTAELIDSIQNVRRLDHSSCMVDHNNVGNTTRFINFEYRQDDEWFHKSRLELDRLRVLLEECAHQFGVEPTQTAEVLRASLEQVEEKVSSRANAVKEIDNQIRALRTASDRMDAATFGKIEAGSAACFRTFGLCALVQGVREHCSEITLWLATKRQRQH